MRKIIYGYCLLLILFLIGSSACEGISENWAVAPILDQAYEISSGNVYLSWKGNAPFYEIHMDGKNVKTLQGNHYTLKVERGSHSFQVYPVVKSQSGADTNFSLDVVGFISAKLDLAAFGLKTEDLALGSPSDLFSIDYLPDPIFSTQIEQPDATTDAQGCVTLIFNARQIADDYQVTIKYGRNDVSYIHFPVGSEETAGLIHTDRNTVSLILDPEYLRQNGSIIPEIGKKYEFTVQLRRYAVDYLTGERNPVVIHDSPYIGKLSYTPTEAWKSAPVITGIRQTADGKVYLNWEHDARAEGCTYLIQQVSGFMNRNTTDIVKTGSHEITLPDLENGTYKFRVIPQYKGRSGTASRYADIRVQNKWQEKPSLNCVQVDSSHVRLSWSCPSGVESYHLAVLIPRNTLPGKLKLTYDVLFETDLEAVPGAMEYLYEYVRPYGESGQDVLKFQLHGIRHAASGDEQQTPQDEKSITLK